MIIETTQKKRGAKVFSFFLLIVWVSGCASWNKATPPRLSFISPTTGNRIEATGNAAEPAKVETEKRQTEIPLPPNSQVSFVEISADPKLNRDARTETVVSLPSQTVFRQTVTHDSIVQAKAFPPPTPPSAMEIAKASGVKWFYIAGAIFAFASLGFLYLEHYKASGIAVLGAFLVPTIGNLIHNQTAQILAAVLGAGCLTLYVAWYLVKGHPEIVSDFSSSLQAEANLVKLRADALTESVKKEAEKLTGRV